MEGAKCDYCHYIHHHPLPYLIYCCHHYHCPLLTADLNDLNTPTCLGVVVAALLVLHLPEPVPVADEEVDRDPREDRDADQDTCHHHHHWST